MITARDVTACLVTRGDQPQQIQKVRDSLIFDDVIVWINSTYAFDAKCAGRYYAALAAKRGIVYFQDDDVIVPADTQQALVDAYKPFTMIANWGHGENPDGYEDLPLVGAGAIVDRDLPWVALNRYLRHYPIDEAFLYEADFIAGVLYPAFEHVHLPFDIDLEIAQHPSRLCNQPWQRDLKLEVTNRARAIRDSEQAGMLAGADK